jgi:hypothetical protein
VAKRTSKKQQHDPKARYRWTEERKRAYIATMKKKRAAGHYRSSAGRKLINGIWHNADGTQVQPSKWQQRYGTDKRFVASNVSAPTTSMIPLDAIPERDNDKALQQKRAYQKQYRDKRRMQKAYGLVEQAHKLNGHGSASAREQIAMQLLIVMQRLLE